MSEHEQWQKQNSEYLAVALQWLRLRLTKLAQTTSPVAPSLFSTDAASTDESAKKSLWSWLTPGDGRIEQKLLPPSVAANDLDQQLEVVAAAMKTIEDSDQPPALTILSNTLGLSNFEKQILLLCAALELDPQAAALCARIQSEARYPTFALAFRLFDEPTWDAVSPERPLRYWRLLEINQPGAQPLMTSALRADERIVSYLKGLNTLDDRLSIFLAPISSNGVPELAPSQQSVVAEALAHWRLTPPHQPLPILQLLGADAASKQLIAAHIAAALGRQLFRLPAETLPQPTGDLETLARLWQRESLLLPLALYVDAQESDHAADLQAPLNRFLSRAEGVILLGTRETRSPLQRASFSLDTATPTIAEQRDHWFAGLSETHGSSEEATRSAELLSSQFHLDAATVAQIIATVPTAEDSQSLHAALWKACRVVTRPHLEALAHRVETKAGWDMLELPAEQKTLLQQIAAQVSQRHQVYESWGFADRITRGLGISALFCGDSGTGKTLAAEVIANELQLDLYRVDLSQVVNKYIGETEKNLRRLFDAADGGGVVLCFDEADALFGKRSEVKDSHDRYANIEVNYLLQRMEAFRGLAILTTNMKSALDQAFLRRLRFIVNFSFPSATERQNIWRGVFPAQTPVNGLDYERLARLNVSGGNIHSIALNAAFLAAGNGGKVTMPIVLNAARAEFRKLGKPINEADFVWNI